MGRSLGAIAVSGEVSGPLSLSTDQSRRRTSLPFLYESHRNDASFRASTIDAGARQRGRRPGTYIPLTDVTARNAVFRPVSRRTTVEPGKRAPRNQAAKW